MQQNQTTKHTKHKATLVLSPLMTSARKWGDLILQLPSPYVG